MKQLQVIYHTDLGDIIDYGHFHYETKEALELEIPLYFEKNKKANGDKASIVYEDENFVLWNIEQSKINSFTVKEV